MRRTVLILALALWLLAAPAGAHPGAYQQEVPVGEPSSIILQVIADEAEDGLVEVEVGVPEEFDLDRVVATPGWTGTREGNKVRWRGGPIAYGQFALFSLAGTAEKGALKFPMITTSAGGKRFEWTDDFGKGARPAAYVFAGVTPEEVFGDGGGDGLSGVQLTGAVLLAVGLAGLAVWWVRQRASA